MRTYLIPVLAILAFPLPALAETIHVGVNGLVCAFCASGIKKALGKEAAVESAEVSLDDKLVTIKTRPQQTLEDAAITKIITEAGYTVTNIHRQE